MKSAHGELEITAADWEVFQSHLRATLTAVCVAEVEGREVLEFCESLRDDIVRH